MLSYIVRYECLSRIYIVRLNVSHTPSNHIEQDPYNIELDVEIVRNVSKRSSGMASYETQNYFVIIYDRNRPSEPQRSADFTDTRVGLACARELARPVKQISEGLWRAAPKSYPIPKLDIVNISSYTGEKLDGSASILAMLFSRLPTARGYVACNSS